MFIPSATVSIDSLCGVCGCTDHELSSNISNFDSQLFFDAMVESQCFVPRQSLTSRQQNAQIYGVKRSQFDLLPLQKSTIRFMVKQSKNLIHEQMYDQYIDSHVHANQTSMNIQEQKQMNVHNSNDAQYENMKHVWKKGQNNFI
jgi:hypothetical protein